MPPLGKPVIRLLRAIAIGVVLGIVGAAILFRLSEQFDDGLVWF